MTTQMKDPDAVLDYAFDWSTWLGRGGDTIDSHVVTAPAGITLNSSTSTTTMVTAWLSGGAVGVTYAVACRIVTTQGRVDDRTMFVSVRQR